MKRQVVFQLTLETYGLAQSDEFLDNVYRNETSREKGFQHGGSIEAIVQDYSSRFNELLPKKFRLDDTRLVALRRGSLTLVVSALLTAYGLFSGYRDFKEGVAMVLRDFRSYFGDRFADMYNPRQRYRIQTRPVYPASASISAPFHQYTQSALRPWLGRGANEVGRPQSPFFWYLLVANIGLTIAIVYLVRRALEIYVN